MPDPRMSYPPRSSDERVTTFIATHAVSPIGSLTDDFRQALLGYLELQEAGQGLEDLWKQYIIASGLALSTQGMHVGQHENHYLPPDEGAPLDLLTAYDLTGDNNNNLLPASGFSGFNQVPDDVNPPTFATQYETDTGNPWAGVMPIVFAPAEYRNVYHLVGWAIDIVEYVFVLKAWNGGIVSASSVATGIAVIDSTVVTGGDTVTVTATLTHVSSFAYEDSSIVVTANFAGGPQVVTLYNKTGLFAG